MFRPTTGLFTGHGPTRGWGQELSVVSRVGSGRGSGRIRSDRIGPGGFSNSDGSGQVGSLLADSTRPDPI